MQDSLPKHIAIIPDGNRRWAKSQGLPSFEGHRRAVDKTIPALVDKAIELRIPFITFWVMSTENFKKRSKIEIGYLLSLMRLVFDKKIREFHKKGMRLKMIGDLSLLPQDIQKMIQEAVKLTERNTFMTLIIGLNYGGRDEIIRGIQRASKDKKIEKLTVKNFGQYLDTKNIPDPDMIIRTGKERRISGFLLWQSEYAEYYFLDKYFPEFTPEDIEFCIKDFVKRQRRFGI